MKENLEVYIGSIGSGVFENNAVYYAGSQPNTQISVNVEMPEWHTVFVRMFHENVNRRHGSRGLQERINVSECVVGINVSPVFRSAL